jgi:hypothetical protein
LCCAFSYLLLVQYVPHKELLSDSFQHYPKIFAYLVE